MGALRILYLGTKSGTCLDRARAYERLGHQVLHIDPRALLPQTAWVDRVTWRLGGQYWAPLLRSALVKTLAGRRFDICHVDCGEWITPATVTILKAHAKKVINYCIDDPTGPRDGARFHAYREALPYYDLVVVMRPQNVDEAKALGARQVMRVYMSADEVSHAPRNMTEEQRRHWETKVLFLGTWMPERGPFLLQLIEHGVPLSIRGAHWQKAPEWKKLQPHWVGGPVSGDEYAYAIQSAQVNLGLLSKGNRDAHTTRSMEVPSLGGVLCAERTDEHVVLYEDKKEAVFWSTAEECAKACMALLADDEARANLAQAGRTRFLSSGYTNQAVLEQVLHRSVSK